MDPMRGCEQAVAISVTLTLVDTRHSRRLPLVIIMPSMTLADLGLPARVVGRGGVGSVVVVPGVAADGCHGIASAIMGVIIMVATGAAGVSLTTVMGLGTAAIDMVRHLEVVL